MIEPVVFEALHALAQIGSSRKASLVDLPGGGPETPDHPSGTRLQRKELFAMHTAYYVIDFYCDQSSGSVPVRLDSLSALDEFYIKKFTRAYPYPSQAKQWLEEFVQDRLESTAIAERFDQMNSPTWCQAVFNSITEKHGWRKQTSLRMVFHAMCLLEREIPNTNVKMPTWDDEHRPRTLLEQSVFIVEAAIGAKPHWQRKINDSVITEKWKAELVAEGYADNVLDHVLGKLRCIEGFRDPEQPHVIPSTGSGYFYSDDLILPGDQANLQNLVEALEGSTKHKDWHPGSNEQVLDIVHPSLYPFVLGMSNHIPPPQWTESVDAGHPADVAHQVLKMIGRPQPREQEMSVASMFRLCELGDRGKVSRTTLHRVIPTFHWRPETTVSREQMGYSRKLQVSGTDRPLDRVELAWPSFSDYLWLPADIQVTRSSPDSIAACFTSYINNLEPDPKKPSGQLYTVLSNIFAQFVPLFEQVLSCDRDSRLLDRASWRWEPELTAPELPGQSFIGEDEFYIALSAKYEADGKSDEFPEEWFNDTMSNWYKSRKLIQPQLPTFQDTEFQGESGAHVSLCNRGLQVVIKIGKIELSPDKPSYKGGTWHVEGTENESIAATGIYYFDSQNVEDPTLSFRESFDQEGPDLQYEQNEWQHFTGLYGLDNDSISCQSIGSVRTSPGRCIVFPNGVQHKVSGFALQDPTKPGYRKLLVFFLVNPERRILSTSSVPPQQFDWWFDRVLAQPNTLFSRLPFDIIAYLRRICECKAYHERRDTSENDGARWPMPLAEAEEHREHLMNERSVFNEGMSSSYEFKVNLCEH